MTRRVIPGEVRAELVERLSDLDENQIPELERQSAAGDVDAFALLQVRRQERDQVRETLAMETAPEGAWDTRRIEVGDAVSVREVGAAATEEFLLVPSSVGTRLETGWVTDRSPLGKALVGAARGEIIEVAAPGGTVRYEVVDFRAA
jgi:transcription elongation GreA/GreB family factor